MSRERQPRATIYDIAQAAETSPAAVSIVLNGHGKKYRIKEETAVRILQSARSLGYKANSKARALRLSKSGLSGMIVPHYRNRLFTGLVEAFEAGSRRRGFCPVVASTQRDRATEAEAVEALLRQEVEFLFLVGMSDPQPLIDMCRTSGVRLVHLDLPGLSTPSVVTDNYLGAQILTKRIMAQMREKGPIDLGDLFFIGGVAGEYASNERFRGFLDTAGREAAMGSKDHFCGYDSGAVRSCLSAIHRSRKLPTGIFINSSPALEGLTQFLLTIEKSEYEDTVFGCFDWDPLGSHFPFLVGMMKHNVISMTEKAFEIIENYEKYSDEIIKIPPTLQRMTS